MKKRILLAMAFGALAAIFAGSASAQPAGSYRGVGLQVGPAGAQSTWSIDLKLGAKGGTIEYPSLKCGGTLTPLPDGRFRETITHGDCVSGGAVGFVPVGGKLIYHWTSEEPGLRDINASAVLLPAGVA